MAGGYRDDDATRGWATPGRGGPDDRTRQLASPRRGGGGPALNAGRLWAGGMATAVVAALIGFVGLLVVRVLLQVPYLAPLRSGALGDSRTALLCASAALAALAATGLAHVLLLSTPSPMAYFGWIAGLLTAIAVVLPLLNDEPIAVRLVTAIIHLTIGLAIISLVTRAALTARA